MLSAAAPLSLNDIWLWWYQVNSVDEISVLDNKHLRLVLKGASGIEVDGKQDSLFPGGRGSPLYLPTPWVELCFTQAGSQIWSDQVRVESSCNCFFGDLVSWHVFLQSENLFELRGIANILVIPIKTFIRLWCMHKEDSICTVKKKPISNCLRAFANGNGQAKYTVFTSRIRVC